LAFFRQLVLFPPDIRRRGGRSTYFYHRPHHLHRFISLHQCFM
jgi:hypothetical protein